MENFNQSGIRQMLREPATTIDIEDANAVLEKFATELHGYCREEKNLAERHRTLMLARGFTSSLSEVQDVEAPKGLSDYIAGTATALINGELDILKMELEHPERFVDKNKAPAPLVLWKGTGAELLEVFTAIHLTGKLLKPTHESMSFSDVITLIRDIFGVRIAGPYDRKTKMFTRAKGGAPFLETLTAIHLGKVEDAYK